MNKRTNIKNELIIRINKILDDFQDFDHPIVNNNGDIIIPKKMTRIKRNNVPILTNIFKEIIKDDLKKNRV